MLRSMYSGISGMKVNQTKLDVIGNNISNVNTTGFKSSRAKFSDLLSQNSSNAMAPSVNRGGTNAKQVGLGVQLASIDKIMTQGSMQTTNRALDVAIDGDGYFIVSAGPVIAGDNTIQVSQKAGIHAISEQSLSNSGTELNYTRDGGFSVDKDGNLLTASGYRVMGYSLTNDDNAQAATSVSPNAVTAGGLTFAFGPGTQLNGYSVVLGKVGPGTSTACKVDKVKHEIIVDGDFSPSGNLKTDQVQKAVNDGLTAEGISQSITVGGIVETITGIDSKTIAGGTDATAPGKVQVGGFSIEFNQGAALNGYTFKLRSINEATPAAEIVPSDPKVILLDGNFSEGNINIDTLKSTINDYLISKNIGDVNNKPIKNITNNSSGFSYVKDKTTTSVAAEAPSISSTSGTVTAATGMYGFTVDLVGKGDDLNAYHLVMSNVAGAPVTATVDKSAGTITISGQLDTINAGNIDTLNQTIASKLSLSGISNPTIKLSGTYTGTAGTSKLYFIGGKDEVSANPDGINLGGFNFSIPKPSELVNDGKSANYLDGYQFNIINITGPSSPTAVEQAPAGSKIINISGDFTSAGSVSYTALQNAINNALGLNGSALVTYKSGTSKAFSGITSSQISGGVDKKDPDQIQGAIGDMNFNIKGGAALNGYKIQVGAITDSTSVDVDTNSKTITVNGNFVLRGAVTGREVESAINNKLNNLGLMGSVEYVRGNAVPIDRTYAHSDNANGGTSVQSLGSDGSVYYVNASNNLKSYDGMLKSLKIPEKVRIAGTSTDLQVKSYSISGTGIINATLSDGRVAALGQIAMASFRNPEGLTTVGDNIVTKSVNSGDPVIMSGTGTTGDDNSKGYGVCRQGYLEMSNVDLAEQFTDMIVTTKAFQASGKMISTGDDILTEIINLKR